MRLYAYFFLLKPDFYSFDCLLLPVEKLVSQSEKHLSKISTQTAEDTLRD